MADTLRKSSSHTDAKNSVGMAVSFGKDGKEQKKLH
jgi:hypothetical protein